MKFDTPTWYVRFDYVGETDSYGFVDVGFVGFHIDIDTGEQVGNTSISK